MIIKYYKYSIFLLLAIYLLLISSTVIGADDNEDLDFFVFPDYEGDFDPLVLKTWEQIDHFYPYEINGLYIKFKNPKTNSLVFGTVWRTNDEQMKYILIVYQYEKDFYKYYFAYDGDESYRLWKKEIIDKTKFFKQKLKEKVE